jgi:glucose-1-phosphate cytidylyltransferase
MKAMILAGGFGSRLAEETDVRPKPMVEIGGKPILWHIMKIYERHGINEFVVCLGYKAEYIKKYFRDYGSLGQDFSVNTKSGEITSLSNRSEDWSVTLLDTGQTTMTGGRIKNAVETLGLKDDFHLTYGDGVADVDISSLTEFHRAHGKLCTVTAVTPPGRFGVLDLRKDGRVSGFREKIASDQYRINGGYFVVNPKVCNLIDGPETVWEQSPLTGLASQGQLMAFVHDGFWQPMDTLRDKLYLDRLATQEVVPWM